MNTKISAVLFDFDGVLVDSGQDIIDAVNHTLREFGEEPLSKEAVLSHIGNGSRALIRDCFGIPETHSHIEQIHHCYMQYYLAHCAEKTVLFPGVEDTLRILRDKQIRCAVITNKSEKLTGKIMDMLGISDLIETLIGPESVEKLKPAPDGIQAVLEAFGANPANAVMIGDSYTDILAGKAAGVRTCAVTYGIGDLDMLFGAMPDYTVDSVIDILDFAGIDKMGFSG